MALTIVFYYVCYVAVLCFISSIIVCYCHIIHYGKTEGSNNLLFNSLPLTTSNAFL